jgi:hypothetical protein
LVLFRLTILATDVIGIVQVDNILHKDSIVEDMLKIVASELEQLQYPDNQIGAIQQQLILAQGQLRGDFGPERRSEEAARQR